MFYYKLYIKKTGNTITYHLDISFFFFFRTIIHIILNVLL